MTQNSTTSKPSTESDTATRKTKWFRIGTPNPAAGFDDLLDLYWSGAERRITGLTLKIIGVNAAALIMLAFGIFYLGQYQKSVIENKLLTFSTEVEMVAATLAETMGQDGIDTPQEQSRLVKRLSQTMNQRIYVFDADGRLLIDSENIEEVSEPYSNFKVQGRKSLKSVRVLKTMAGFIIQFLPERRILPPYPDEKTPFAENHPDAAEALEGKTSMSAWHDDGNRIFLTAAAPMYRNAELTGAVMLARNGKDIEEDIGAVWANILKVFIITLFITVLLSIYLSGTIASPLRKLAAAAEGLRKGKNVDIPDLSERKDEIGELSIVMREMAQALGDRIDMIERFAADVAHELKNPLTSLKSAVETLAIVKTEKDRNKLMEIVTHDIERMDRLISDISNASRLDAELSRETLQPVNIRTVLHRLIDLYKSPLDRGSPGKISVIKAADADINIAVNDMTEKDMYVWGFETRLGQVFENLLSNAVSFSPAGGTVNLTIIPVKKRIVITVEDEGPGIPENRLEKIFERFYTERPQHEDYGRHSGLGLSICKQILMALGGQIFAENIKDENQRVTGARFTVILNKIQ